jgi:hypothetical protein
MPTDPTPEGLGIRNKPLDKPFPEPTPKADNDEDREREGRARRSLVTPDMEEPAETNRPPLGN